MSRVRSGSRVYCIVLTWLMLAMIIAGSVRAEQAVRIGVVEGGEYVWHVVLRQLIHEELPRLLPDTVRLEFVPSGYVTSEWNQEQFRTNVTAMLARERLDLVLAVGPWSVEALLDAGCTVPIVAMHRFDPEAERLIDSTGRPVAENLTVTAYENRYARDLAALFGLMPAEKIGFLLFPSDDESERVMTKLRALGERADFEVVTAGGANAVGTFAFFKAYQSLDKDIDALYISPTWGMSGQMTGEFLAMVARDRIPVVSSEGIFHVTRGAMLANSGSTAIPEAMVAAWKIKRIIEGATPADLPVWWQPPSGLTVNEQTASMCGVEIDDYTASFSLVIPEKPSTDELPLTLGSAISMAIAANPGYLAGYEHIAAAVKEAEAARAAYLPELSLDARAGYVDDNTVANSLPTESNWQGEISLSLYQRIYSPTTIQKIKAIGQNKTDAELSHRRAQLDLEQAVVLAYLNLVEAEQLLSSEINQQQVLSRFLEYEAARGSLPDGPPVTAQVRWQAEKGLASRRLLLARGNREIARVLLNALLGRTLETAITIDPSPFQAAPFEADAVALRGLIGTVAQRRAQAEQLAIAASTDQPDLAALDSRIVRLGNQKRIDNASYLPEIGFRASFGAQDKLENQFGFEEQHTTWSAGLQLHWPLFRGGARGKQAASWDLETSRLEYVRDDHMHMLRSDLFAALTRVSQAVFSGVLTGNAAIDAQTHLTELARHPDTTLTVLLDAVATFSRMEREAIDTRLEYYRETVRATHRMGWSLNDRNALPSAVLLEALRATGIGAEER